MLLLCTFNFCKAQDTTILLSPSMFGQTSQEIIISQMDGWLFKEGNDTSWAGKIIDNTGWKKLKPTELTAKYADKNGRAEGWFRLKLKLDTSFGDMPLQYRILTWAAADLYADGNLQIFYGNTEQNGAPFRESSVNNYSATAVKLKPGNEITIAIHMVDYLSPFPPRRLKSEDE